MRILGLTGGIGSGKSTVARMLAACGAEIIDADVLAREVVQPGSPTLARVVARFGADLLTPDGALDRPRLARLIFGDDRARADLDAIMHPAIALRAQEEIAARAARGATVVIYDVPLLFETGLDRAFPEVIVVSAPPEVQRARLAARDGLADAEIAARLRAQLPLSEKVRRATHVIDNGGVLAETDRQVRALWAELARNPG